MCNNKVYLLCSKSTLPCSWAWSRVSTGQIITGFKNIKHYSTTRVGQEPGRLFAKSME